MNLSPALRLLKAKVSQPPRLQRNKKRSVLWSRSTWMGACGLTPRQQHYGCRPTKTFAVNYRAVGITTPHSPSCDPGSYRLPSTRRTRPPHKTQRVLRPFPDELARLHTSSQSESGLLA